MDDVLQSLGHLGFTLGAWLTAHWTEVGAGILMLLQGAVLIYKLIDRKKKGK
jgi:hypothetical protein